MEIPNLKYYWTLLWFYANICGKHCINLVQYVGAPRVAEIQIWLNFMQVCAPYVQRYKGVHFLLFSLVALYVAHATFMCIYQVITLVSKAQTKTMSLSVDIGLCLYYDVAMC